MKRMHTGFVVLLALALLLAACGQSAPAPAADKLGEITARGTLLVSTDPAYPPQSELAENAQRPAGTKCASDQRTAAELKGFDIDVAVEIAKRLGVEACFTTPDWTLITAGHWADRWDISVGSMTVTPERMANLFFSLPYYTTPAAFFVHKDNTTFTKPADLSGKKIGACSGCTYDAYLASTLKIPGETITYVVENPAFTGYETDLNALQDLALGDGTRLDAVLTALPTGQGSIGDGLPLKQLGEAVYFEYLSAAFDKFSTKDSWPLVQKVSEVIAAMHKDGTLGKLSQQYYGIDLTSGAASFDFAGLKQK